MLRKTIRVNDPLRYGGITIYQTDWSFSALQILKDGEGPFNLAMAPLKINGDKKLFGTFLPVGDTDSPNIKGMYVCFGTSFNFVGFIFKPPTPPLLFFFPLIPRIVSTKINV